MSVEERAVLQRVALMLRSPLRASNARLEAGIVGEAVRVLQAIQAREVSNTFASLQYYPWMLHPPA